MATRKIVLTVNPHGGVKSGRSILERVKPVLDNGGFEMDIIETRYGGHARDIARSIDLEPYEAFCAIGGDGTMHELLNGLLTRPDGHKIPVGLITGGTGNSFMHDMNCLDPIEAAQRIVRGYTMDIDLAKVTMDHKVVYAFNIVGWGMVTDINIRSEKVRWMGESRYTYSTMMEIIRSKSRHAQLTIEGTLYDEDFTFILGCNTQHTGKGMLMAPRAKLDDGLIDLLVVRNTSRNKLLNLFPKVFTGEHIHSEELDYRQVTDFSIVPDEDDPLNIDGEMVGSTPIHVTVEKKAFTTYVDKDYSRS